MPIGWNCSRSLGQTSSQSCSQALHAALPWSPLLASTLPPGCPGSSGTPCSPVPWRQAARALLPIPSRHYLSPGCRGSMRARPSNPLTQGQHVPGFHPCSSVRVWNLRLRCAPRLRPPASAAASDVACGFGCGFVVRLGFGLPLDFGVQPRWCSARVLGGRCNPRRGASRHLRYCGFHYRFFLTLWWFLV